MELVQDAKLERETSKIETKMVQKDRHDVARGECEKQ